MNKKGFIILIVVLVILAGIGIYFYFFNDTSKNEKTNYEANKTSSNNSSKNETNTTTPPENSQNETNSTPPLENSQNKTNTQNAVVPPSPQHIEEQLSTFTTKIYSKDSSRQTNISITCNLLNGTVVKNGSTFSFCNTVGQATTAKGYQKADVFDNDGNKKKGLGGGNCQISSTLYNAVLANTSLVVTERHEHSNYVPYVKKGKDAAVAYGSYDFKFRNNSGNDIKINASTDGKSVTTTLISLKTV